jgi:hypothetical protein
VKHYVPNPGVPDFAKIVALFVHHHNQAFPFVWRYSKALEVGSVQHDDSPQSQIRLVYQVNAVAAVLHQQIANGVRVVGILDGQLNGFHSHSLDTQQFASHCPAQFRMKTNQPVAVSVVRAGFTKSAKIYASAIQY